MGCSSSKVEYIGHLEGTSHHKTKVSWKEYYQHNIDLRKNNSYEKVRCPCTSKPHSLVGSPDKNPVGAHVYHIDNDGYITFGIILTCNSCNRSENEFVSPCQMITMINCPEVKCVPFDPILKYENLDNYKSENNNFELSRSSLSIKATEKNKYKYEWTNVMEKNIKSGNYINFIINLNKLSYKFFRTQNEKISIYRYKSKNKKNIRFSPTKPLNVPDDGKEGTPEGECTEDSFWENIEYKKKYKNYKKIKKKRKSDFKIEKHLYLTENVINEKNNNAFMKNLSKELYENLYCKIIKQRRGRKCFCGNKFSDSSPGSCIIFAKNNEGECIMGVVPFCSECMKKERLPELSEDEKKKGKKIYMNAVSIVDFYTLRSALDFPNITKIEFTTTKNEELSYKLDNNLQIYEKKSEDKEIETELWDKGLNFIEFIHSMNKLRKELYENCGETDKEFVPQVVKILIDG